MNQGSIIISQCVLTDRQVDTGQTPKGCGLCSGCLLRSLSRWFIAQYLGLPDCASLCNKEGEGVATSKSGIQSAICLRLWLMSLYCTWIRVYNGVLWSPNKHQHHSRCLCSYQGPCSVIKPALYKLGREQSTEGHCNQYMKEGWQCFREEWQRNHIWCCVHVLWLRFMEWGVGWKPTTMHETPHSPASLTGRPQGALLEGVNVIDPHFPKEMETS